jgi:vacuolar-type H+-ATPase subunit B/Vma2
MDAGWTILRLLPKSEMARLSDAQIARYVDTKGEADA